MSREFIQALPRKFTEVITAAFRDDGRRWIESLPRIIRKIEENWQVKIDSPFPNLSYHYVAPCVRAEGSEAVVKIGFPGEAKYILNERKMLEYLDGGSVNRILDFDEQRLAFLLEKLVPGENLKTVCARNPQRAVAIAIETMRSFWQYPPSNNDFPRLEDWFEGLQKAEETRFPADYASKAREFFDELSSAPDEKMLLHGDFHHENILSAGRRPFLAIDPKGIVGHRAYDAAVFLLNHANWLKNEPGFREKLSDAIERFSAALEIEQRDLRRWCFAQGVLSAWWTFEDNCENFGRDLEFTKIWEV